MSAIGKLFGGGEPAKATITAPTVQPVAPLVGANDDRVRQSKLRKRRQLSANQGRASTLLDNNREFKNESLG